MCKIESEKEDKISLIHTKEDMLPPDFRRASSER